MIRRMVFVAICGGFLAQAAIAQVNPMAYDESTGPNVVVFFSPHLPSHEKHRALDAMAALGLAPTRIEPFSAREQNGILFKRGYRALAETLSSSLGNVPLVEIDETADFDLAVDLGQAARAPAAVEMARPPAAAEDDVNGGHRSAIHLTAFVGLFSPIGRIGETFGALPGGGATLGYPWADDAWAVEAAAEIYQLTIEVEDLVTAEVIRGRLRLFPVSASLLHTFGSDARVRPYFGIGAVLQSMTLSNTQVFEGLESGRESRLARGYAVRAGVRVGIWNRVMARADLGWLAPQTLFAEKREGAGIRFAIGLGF